MEENIFEQIKSENIILPLTVLNGYANSFNETFKERLVFELKKKMEDESDPWDGIGLAIQKKDQEEKSYVTRAYVVAPGLGNYRLLVLKLSYKISEVYPCRLENMLEDTGVRNVKECENSIKLNDDLLKLFQSDEFQRPIKMLLSQLEA